METTTNLRKFLGGAMMASQSNGEEENRGDEIVFQELTTKIERSSPDHHESGSSSSAKKGHLDDQLESTKAEIDEVMEENQRLKVYLDRILKDYRTLQIQYRDFIQQEAIRKSQNPHDQTEEPEFVALSLGRTSSGAIKVEPNKSPINDNNIDKESLTPGLDSTLTKVEVSPNPSPENSIEEMIKKEAEQTSPHNKMKNVRDGGEDDILSQNPAKRARVSVRVRCDTPSMNDGCQWRKYGQKISKGNPCPRAYYRCTVAPSCPVRKQVQRCADDMSILITTYEGTHNHPLPTSATAMASTTSAAVSMLLSGSSTSGSGPNSSSIPPNLNGLNYYLSENARPKSSIYLSNTSISSTPSFPTITLDLTSTQPSSSNITPPANFPPRYSTTNLNFNSLESNPLPNSWSNNMLTSYNASNHQQYNRTFQNTSNSLNFGAPQSHETLYQSYLNQNNQQSLAPDTIAAASKAIASDPSFQSALVAALSSMIGSGSASTSVTGNQHGGENLISQNIKSSEPFRIMSSFPSIAENANKCLPSFMNKSFSSAAGTQQGNLMFLSPSLPFSSSKSKSNSPGSDHIV